MAVYFQRSLTKYANLAETDKLILIEAHFCLLTILYSLYSIELSEILYYILGNIMMQI